MDMSNKYPEPGQVKVVGTTGIASVNINGETLNRWGGFQIETEYERMLSLCWSKKENWRKAKVLIIDEISMLEGNKFDNLNKIAQRIRGNGMKFGGIQLVMTGDFFQLPPVPSKKERGNKKVLMLFQGKSFEKCVDEFILLTKIYRQSNRDFVRILNNVRFGRLTQEDENLLMSYQNRRFENGIEPTQLHSNNFEVNKINEKRLNDLRSDKIEYTAADLILKQDRKRKLHQKVVNGLFKSGRVEEKVAYKVGAQVMLVKNISKTLVNGSRGKIIGFKTFIECEDSMVDQKFFRNSGSGRYDYSDNNQFWRKNGGIDPMKRLIPIVEFFNKEIEAIPPEGFPIKTDFYEVCRVQIPLKLAWALTVHKSQGLSIDYVEISMKNMFENGHFYVALSRCRSLEGLSIKNFDKRKIKVNQDVIDWMNKTFFDNLRKKKKRKIIKANTVMNQHEQEKKEVPKLMPIQIPKKHVKKLEMVENKSEGVKKETKRREKIQKHNNQFRKFEEKGVFHNITFLFSDSMKKQEKEKIKLEKLIIKNGGAFPIPILCQYVISENEPINCDVYNDNFAEWVDPTWVFRCCTLNRILPITTKKSIKKTKKVKLKKNGEIEIVHMPLQEYRYTKNSLLVHYLFENGRWSDRGTMGGLVRLFGDKSKRVYENRRSDFCDFQTFLVSDPKQSLDIFVCNAICLLKRKKEKKKKKHCCIFR